jgi:hypothetical protein
MTREENNLNILQEIEMELGLEPGEAESMFPNLFIQMINSGLIDPMEEEEI